MFTQPVKTPVKANELMSVFDVAPLDVYEAWKVYSGMRDAGLLPKMVMGRMATMTPQILTPEIRDYLASLMLETLTADTVRLIRYG